MRMFISSFYNTLINNEEAIPVSTMLEIEKLKNKGILFSVCTNRLKDDVLYYNHDYPFIDYIISLNGNYIYDVSKEKCIYKNSLNKSVIKKIESIFNDYEIIKYKEDNIIYKLEIKIKNKEQYLVDKLNDLDVYKSIFKLGKDYFIEVTKHSTYEGIIKLLDMLKIKNKETISVIGNLSEKELVNNIENTYVVSNAPKELKDLSTSKTKSNNFKGVENIIKKYN